VGLGFSVIYNIMPKTYQHTFNNHEKLINTCSALVTVIYKASSQEISTKQQKNKAPVLELLGWFSDSSKYKNTQ
jgi:hypothetical protein